MSTHFATHATEAEVRRIDADMARFTRFTDVMATLYTAFQHACSLIMPKTPLDPRTPKTLDVLETAEVFKATPGVGAPVLSPTEYGHLTEQLTNPEAALLMLRAMTAGIVTVAGCATEDAIFMQPALAACSWAIDVSAAIHQHADRFQPMDHIVPELYKDTVKDLDIAVVFAERLHASASKEGEEDAEAMTVVVSVQGTLHAIQQCVEKDLAPWLVERSEEEEEEEEVPELHEASDLEYDRQDAYTQILALDTEEEEEEKQKKEEKTDQSLAKEEESRPESAEDDFVPGSFEALLAATKRDVTSDELHQALQASRKDKPPALPANGSHWKMSDAKTPILAGASSTVETVETAAAALAAAERRISDHQKERAELEEQLAAKRRHGRELKRETETLKQRAAALRANTAKLKKQSAEGERRAADARWRQSQERRQAAIDVPSSPKKYTVDQEWPSPCAGGGRSSSSSGKKKKKKKQQRKAGVVKKKDMLRVSAETLAAQAAAAVLKEKRMHQQRAAAFRASQRSRIKSHRDATALHQRNTAITHAKMEAARTHKAEVRALQKLASQGDEEAREALQSTDQLTHKQKRSAKRKKKKKKK
jgi:hypothetical protein